MTNPLCLFLLNQQLRDQILYIFKSSSLFSHYVANYVTFEKGESEGSLAFLFDHRLPAIHFNV